ncbi:MAG: DNA translocase FtsK 4TM domain-containing protein [Gemmatimonadetes bacterium]|nr:DNA translocase FtsK 4TM domain-containing protein [Gemmatimonadota bacterium]
MLSPGQRRDLLGLSLLALGVFTLLSLVPPGVLGSGGSRLFAAGNLMGALGAALRHGGTAFLGAGVPVLPALLGLLGAACFGWLAWETAFRWAALLTAVAVLLPAFLALFTPEFASRGAFLDPALAGWIGRTLALPLVALIGWLGTALLLPFLGVVASVTTVGHNPIRLAGRVGRRGGGLLAGLLARRRAAAGAVAVEEDPLGPEVDPPELEPLEDEAAEAPDRAVRGRTAPPAADAGAKPAAGARVLSLVRKPKRAEPAPSAPDLAEFGDPESSETPPVSLLSPPPPRDVGVSEAELDRLGEVLVRTLRTFKVEGAIVGRTTGPVVTQFEVVPAPGIKVNRIAALDADLALALKAPSVRIVAPIPGKGAVGVEVPNPQAEVVALREILEASAFQKAKGALPLALGKDLTGKPYVADLARMPHLLIAGATGSGKSVCVNTIITSLIYRHSPKTLRLLMVDPKMVELSMYGDLPHLRHPVITNPQDAATVLKWAVLEMERRYELLSVNGVRSLGEFNRRVEEGQIIRRANPVGDGTDEDAYIYKDGPLPYIVVIIDELADLMMAVQAEVEKPLAQLAQKARAIGIHLIVATQRPSVNVITGLIKANFPCRIAFRVSAKVDSRTILDQNGADALLGNGDMLFLPPGTSDPVRIQGAYLATDETDRLMKWYREQSRARAMPNELEEDILEVVRAREAEEAGAELGEASTEERDKLFREAAEICIQAQQGSTSLLQRRLKIGYGRAARIIDQLHVAGVLGPPDGSRPREVLVGYESLAAICGDD